LLFRQRMGGRCSKSKAVQATARQPTVVLLGKLTGGTEGAKEDVCKRIRTGRVTQAVGKLPPTDSEAGPTLVRQRTFDVVTEDFAAHRKPRAMGAGTRELIRSSLRQDRLCAMLTDEEVDMVLETMEKFEFEAEDVVVTQGQVGNTFFVVEEGSLSVSVNGNVSNTLSKGNSFGGLALLYQCPRTASVTALSGVTCWGASGPTFQKVLRENAQRRYAENRKFLDSIQLFDGLPGKLKDALATGVRAECHDAGARVATEGEAAKAIFLAKRGELRVCRGGRVAATGELLGGTGRKLALGECFGDRELLRQEPYSATVVADGKCELLTICGTHLREVLGHDLQACLERALVVSAIRRSSGLSKLSFAQQEAVVEAVTIRTHGAHEPIEEGLRFALVIEGSIEQQGGRSSQSSFIVKRGEWFEDEVLSADFSSECESGRGSAAVPGLGRQRSATAAGAPLAAGAEGCRLAALPGAAFAEALAVVAGLPAGQTPGEAMDLSRKMLLIRKANVFRHLSHEQLDTVAKAFASETYTQDDVVVRQGEMGTAFFVLASGELRVSIDTKVIRTLGKNACFGERALLFDEPRSATIDVVSGSAEVWSLEKKVFSQIVMGKMQQQLVERIKLQDTSVTLKDLVHCKLIGAGACGSVRLVEHRSTHTRYALKRVLKKNGRIPSEVRREIELLAENDHPFIQTYVKTMQTEDSIYMLTELVTGGELHAAIRTIPTVLSRSQAQFYTGSLVLVLEELAGRDIVYRDLKPENVMLDAQGYLKLIDFGIAKKLRDVNLRTFTVVGTPHYMAPEILQGRGYGLEVDIWSLGILLFEFVCGHLPFADDLDQNNEVWQAVLREPLKFPPRFRDTAGKSLITGLLERRPSERLGGGVNGYEDIKMHPYFRASSSKSVPPPADFSKEPPLFGTIVGREQDPPVVPKAETYTDPSDLAHIELDDAHQLYSPPTQCQR